MKNSGILFEERQFIGYNKHTLSLRLFLAIFCFVAYYFTDIPEVNGDLLFFLGIAILIISVILLFVTHIHTVIDDKHIRIDGFMKSGKVLIPVDQVSNAEKTPYSKYLINYPVYNLHKNGTIRFYTGGHEAVLITMRDGSAYLIGSKKAGELVAVLRELTGKS